MMESPSLVVVTRIHGVKALENALKESFRLFVQNTEQYANKVVVCIGANSLEILHQYESRFNEEKQSFGDFGECIIIVPVFPWGYFTTALNSGLIVALDQQPRFILFQVHR
jgi:hypothetical protein